MILVILVCALVMLTLIDPLHRIMGHRSVRALKLSGGGDKFQVSCICIYYLEALKDHDLDLALLLIHVKSATTLTGLFCWSHFSASAGNIGGRPHEVL
jgi:hypothetical protein